MPMPPMSPKQQLERLISGLEMSLQNTTFELKYAEPGSIEEKYTKKFLDAVKEHLERSKKELAELQQKETLQAKDG